MEKATRNVKKEENDIKEEQVENGLRTSPPQKLSEVKGTLKGIKRQNH